MTDRYTTARTGRGLLIDAHIEENAGTFRRRFPDIDFTLCRSEREIDSLPGDSVFDFAYSCKSSLLPGKLIRDAVIRHNVPWVQVGGAGFDHLLPVANDAMIVTNSSGVLSNYMAEAVIGAILMMNFGFHHYLRHQQQRVWRQNDWTSVEGKTILIVGLGNIGRAVAAQARHFGMTVLAVRNRPRMAEHVHEVHGAADLHDILPRADVVTIHVPLTPATDGLFSDREFGLMKQGAILSNTSRGRVVDELALGKALESGRLGAAYMDVFETEPLPDDSPMWSLPNLFISPHMADSVSDWASRFQSFFLDNLQRFVDGEQLQNVVDVKRGY